MRGRPGRRRGSARSSRPSPSRDRRGRMPSASRPPGTSRAAVRSPCGIISAPASLGEACADQHPRARRRAAEGRCEREAGDAEQEQAATTEHVAKPPAGQQPDGERQRIAADDPLQRGRGGMQGGGGSSGRQRSQRFRRAGPCTRRQERRRGSASASGERSQVELLESDAEQRSRTTFVIASNVPEAGLPCQVPCAWAQESCRRHRVCLAIRRPRPVGPRHRKLSRETIVDAALAIVDRDGLDALTMRSVATRSARALRRCTRTSVPRRS